MERLNTEIEKKIRQVLLATAVPDLFIRVNIVSPEKTPAGFIEKSPCWVRVADIIDPDIIDGRAFVLVHNATLSGMTTTNLVPLERLEPR